MKNFLKLFLIIYILLISIHSSAQNEDVNFRGAWRSGEGVIIFSGNFFSYALFEAQSKSFAGTYGGGWSYDNHTITLNMEYNTFDNSIVGQKINKQAKLDAGKLIIEGQEFIRIDNGIPGELEGAWLFSGRKRNDEIQTRDTNQPRKTMKILSGTRFQWIAYNTETGAFSGTGGGTYTTIDNQYTEDIDFFSRDNSRVGASLTFNYELIDGIWNHSGLNSRGEPLYEFWSPRRKR